MKLKIGFYWCSSCGGCEETIVDLNENILKVVEAADILFWPVALDFKYSDIEAMPDKHIDVCFINGAIRMDEQEKIAKLFRQKSKVVVAFGACAHLGGIPGLANQYSANECIDRAYKKSVSTINPEGITPQPKAIFEGKELELPVFYDRVKTLAQTIDVDYFLPGCPPQPDSVLTAFNAIVNNELPPAGTVIGSKKALCETCERNKTKPDKMKIEKFNRYWETELDNDTCFLLNGVICMGLATRGGCGEKCISANMPCSGCYGPLDNVRDHGASALSAIASLIDSNSKKEIKQIIDEIPDPLGTFYRYSLPSSILKGSKKK